MAYEIGQLIKKKETNYLEEKQIFISSMTSVVKYGNININFEDPYIEVPSRLVSEDTYYLSFYADRMVIGTDLIPFSFDIILNGEQTISQYIRTINIEKGMKDDKVFVGIIFTPNDTYNGILFNIQRTTQDLEVGKEKKLVLSEVNLQKINNIIPEEVAIIEKIGIQAPSGQLFTLNGEEIMIGRTGIYELYNKNIPITYLGFAIDKEDENSFFIVDYQYIKKEGN